MVDLHHFSADHLIRNLEELWTQLAADPVEGAEARLALGALISRIKVEPKSKRGQYAFVIEGDLAAFMGPAREGEDFSYPLVAGAGFHLNLRKPSTPDLARHLCAMEDRVGLFRSAA